MRRNILLGAACLICCIAAWGVAAEDEPTWQRAAVHVGIDEGDFRGDDNRALQAAVDYLAGLGGGTVHVGPGVFTMRNSLTMRDHVRVVGTPGETILRAGDPHGSPLLSTAGTYERQITVADPSGIQIGDGVQISDDLNQGGFAVTQATIVAKLGDNTFRISRPLVRDYRLDQNARVDTGFPIVGLWGVEDAALEGLVIDGNGQNVKHLNGCRGAGIYLFESNRIVIRDCTVRNYNGDGISFQDSDHVLIEDCVCKENTHSGLHPGCGSQHAVVRRTEAVDNGHFGLFVCWRVKHGLFEDNDLSRNKYDGISIGLKDTDNLFRKNTINGNGKTGIHFRDLAAAEGAHRNVFEQNEILDNGACIVVDGEHHDLVFRSNRLGTTTPPAEPVPALVSSARPPGLEAEQNKFLNVQPIE